MTFPPTLAKLLETETSIANAIKIQNTYDKNLLKKFIDEKITKKEYSEQVSERLKGQWQWGTCSYNIRRSDVACKHKCIYCYVDPMFKRWGRECTPTSIEEPMAMDIKKVNKKWKKTDIKSMIFFPSSSDIFYENAVSYVSVCKNIIDAGNEVFFATKPTLKTIKLIVEEIEKLDTLYKQKMSIFITLTSSDNKILKEYEPYASTFEERIKVIELLRDHDFNVNIMMEPYLSDPVKLAKDVLPILPQTGIIAIGQMNYMSNIKLNDIQKKYLEELYSDDNIKKLWAFAKKNNRMYLKKDSVKAVMRVY